MDFIKKILDEAYESGVSYDIRDLRPNITTFALDSTNQAQACFDISSALHYCSQDYLDGTKENVAGTDVWEEAPIVFYDVEVFPNLFIICWKKEGVENKVVKMINPTPEEVKRLFAYRLVGFYNRRYDNHIIYAWTMGYTIDELYRLSQRIICGADGATFGEAYGISYTDIWDYSTKKQSLKKWEIDLGIFHLENAHPWDEPVPEEYWEEIADYCENDVVATEAVWNATKTDFKARQILADISGGTVNDTTNALTLKIVFGNERYPEMVYTDLATGEQEVGR